MASFGYDNAESTTATGTNWAHSCGASCQTLCTEVFGTQSIYVIVVDGKAWPLDGKAWPQPMPPLPTREEVVAFRKSVESLHSPRQARRFDKMFKEALCRYPAAVRAPASIAPAYASPQIAKPREYATRRC